MEAATVPAARARHHEGCLFCRGHRGPFLSREHIFSESWGNTTYVLPTGVVCDPCNNGPLARGDEELVSFEPIRLLCAERGLPTKAGEAVDARFGNARVYFTGHGQMTVETNSRKVTRRMQDNSGELDLIGRRVTTSRARLITRAVWKSALELLYVDRGSEAFDGLYDGLRAAVLDDAAHGWAAVPKTGKATENVTLEYERRVVGDREAMPVCLSVFGVEFYTDALRRDIPEPEIDPPWPGNVWTF